MTSDRPETPIWYKSLGIRLAAMMSLALFPIGLIAVMQTNSVSEKARENARLALLGLTESAAVNERLVIQQSFGAAGTLAAQVPFLLDDPEACSEMFSRFVEGAPLVSYSGFLPESGYVTCSSTGLPYDFSDSDVFKSAMTDRTRQIGMNADAPISGTSVIVVMEPVIANDVFIGFVTVSIPHAAIDTVATSIDVDALVDIVTFNDDGKLLTSQLGVSEATGNLPFGNDLTDLQTETSTSFFRRSINGDNLIYTVVPVQFGKIYVLGIWDADIGVAEQTNGPVPTSFFPVLMWIISLGVALLAVHRLVTRHIKTLELQMRQFAVNRRLIENGSTQDMPTELRNIHSAFTQMADAIVRDEAVIEDAMRQKSVLLKEVHHRVKNNLQLISSILNMQIRAAPYEDTKIVLRRMQDRVLSLATIHRDLYQTTSRGAVNVGNLVREIVDKSVEIGGESEGSVKVTTNIEDVLLYPDQAVPMSLLASEAATNAMKYGGGAKEGSAFLSVTFTCDDDRNCYFELKNSIGDITEAEGTGMGSKLISAFAIQLGADIDVEQSDSEYALYVRFKTSEFELEPGNF